MNLKLTCLCHLYFFKKDTPVGNVLLCDLCSGLLCFKSTEDIVLLYLAACFFFQYMEVNLLLFEFFLIMFNSYICLFDFVGQKR